jgi:hypothetical protein
MQEVDSGSRRRTPRDDDAGPSLRSSREDGAGVPRRTPDEYAASVSRPISHGAITTSERDGNLVPISRTFTPPEGSATEHHPEQYRDPTEHPLSDQPGPSRQGGITPHHAPTPEVGSEVLIPTGDHPPPSEVVIPDFERFAEAFNDAEDERRIRHQDAERLRDERAVEAEDRRDEEFREHEAERQRIFEEGEKRRNEPRVISGPGEDEARPASTAEDIHSIHSSPKSPSDIVAGDAQSSEVSVKNLEDDFARLNEEHEQNIRVLQQECEDERARLVEEHDQSVKAREQEWEDERVRIQEEHENELNDLREEQNKVQEELVTFRETTEAEKIERERIDTERIERQEMDHQDQISDLRTQLEEMTNMLDTKTAEYERLQALNDERWAAKEERRTKKVEEFQSLKDLVQRIIDENEAAKVLEAQERERDAEKPGRLSNICPSLNLTVSQELMLFLRSSSSRIRNKRQSCRIWLAVSRQSKAISDILIVRALSGWLKESERLHSETLETVKATANIQVPYNIQEVSH